MPARDSLKFWNNWASHYDWFMSRSMAMYQQIADLAKETLTKEMDALEVACGTGILSEMLAPHVRQLEATDYSPAMIEEAKKKAVSSRLHFSVQDAAHLPYDDASFDAVIIANALHIVPEPEKILAELRRVLKPGGLLIAPTFIVGKGLGFRLRSGILKLAGFRLQHKWDGEQLAAFLSENHFAPENAHVLGPKMAPLCYIQARAL